MEEFQMNPIILAALISLIVLLFTNKILSAASAGKRLPPSPPKLPIIGNLHQLGSLSHHNLHSLSQNHGPIMLLHIGTAPLLIISSARWAREITKTHDLTFASRPGLKMFKKMAYDCNDVAAAPYGEQWRKMKSILVWHLLSNSRVQASCLMMEEETALFVEKIREASGPVNLSAMFKKFTNDVICRSAFGRRYSESENGKKFLMLVEDFAGLTGSMDVGYFMPWLSWISGVNGVDKKMDRFAKEMDEILECVIQEHVESKGLHGRNGENFLDLMLDGDDCIDRDSIKPLMFDIFVGGTDTTLSALEWTMTELLRHPAIMKKLQHDIRGIVRSKHNITHDDLEKMHYLKAVIKEIFRYHPPAPLLLPRIAREDVEINGYDISAGTVVMINMWAIGRDPVSWNKPKEFKPERFLNSSTDFKGLDFELIPFGAGRRICPGMTFSVAAIELVLANLVHKFDWKLTNGVEGKDLEMDEIYGVAVHKKIPLLAVASQIE